LFPWLPPLHGGEPGDKLDFGFLFFRGHDLRSNELTTALGPFYEARSSDSRMALHAVRPFYSVLEEDSRDRRLQEILWPVGMIKDFQGQRAWRFLLMYGDDFNDTQPDSRYRFVIFPVIYAGRDKDSRKYFAVFPLGGRIREYLGQDEMSFVLFPLYGSSRINEMQSHSVLWPIIGWGSGDNARRFRVFPLYGRSERDEQWIKTFVLWPLWTSVRYTYPDQPGGGFVLFPLYGHVKAGDDTESWMLIPPLFRYSKSSEQVEWHAPWPILQYASGQKEKMYVWPLWGRKRVGPVRSWFCAWPILAGETIERDASTTRRFELLPFIQHETRTAHRGASSGEAGGTNAAIRSVDTSSAAGADARHLKLWPLLDYRRQGGDKEFRMLALWPFRNATSMDRNYAPFWTLYSHQATTDGVREDELLWGLFRWRRDDGGSRDVSLFPLFSESKQCDDSELREWRLLLGLVGYRREESRKSWRLLYLFHWQTGNDDAEP
jgi:hypothetical protein